MLTHMDNRSLPDSQSIFATELLFLLHFRFSVGGVHQVRRNTLDVYRIITKVLAFCVSAFSAHITFRGDVIPPVMKNSLKGYWIDAYGHTPTLRSRVALRLSSVAASILRPFLCTFAAFHQRI